MNWQFSRVRSLAEPMDVETVRLCKSMLAHPVRTASDSLLGNDPMAKQTKWWHLALAWGFVGVPLIWGVIQTVLNAMKLFS